MGSSAVKRDLPDVAWPAQHSCAYLHKVGPSNTLRRRPFTGELMSPTWLPVRLVAAEGERGARITFFSSVVADNFPCCCKLPQLNSVQRQNTNMEVRKLAGEKLPTGQRGMRDRNKMKMTKLHYLHGSNCHYFLVRNNRRGHLTLTPDFHTYTRMLTHVLTHTKAARMSS